VFVLPEEPPESTDHIARTTRKGWIYRSFSRSALLLIIARERGLTDRHL
jgi:hypothetical protein